MFYVIAVDGGGARTLLSAYIIKEIQQLLIQENIDSDFPKFDLYAGTSAGSIVASFLSIHKTPSEICDLFESMCPHIFPEEQKKIYDLFPKWGIIESKYKTETLKSILNTEFQDLTFQDIYSTYSSRLMIPAVDINPVGSRILKTPYTIKAEKDQYIYLKDAITASCVAPTYFDPHTFTLNNPHISAHTRELCCADGGLFVGNPAMTALIEGMQCVKGGDESNYLKIKDIKVLSIGSLLSSIRYEVRPPFWWKWGIGTGWKAAQFVDTVMEIQKAHVHNMMKRFMPESNYLRLECDIAEKIGIDFNVKEYKDFFQLRAKELIRTQKEKILAFFR